MGTNVSQVGTSPSACYNIVSLRCLLDGDCWGEMRVRWKGGWGQLGPPASTELLLQCQLDRRQAMRGAGALLLLL